MFVPFLKEEKVLDERPFLDYEVQFNLFHKIVEGNEFSALKTEDGNAIALQSPGHSMWFWINESLEEPGRNLVISSLCQQMKENKLSGISGKPEYVKNFASQYSELVGANYDVSMGMMAYQCLNVIHPKNVLGNMIKPDLCNVDIVAEFCAGFISQCFEKEVTKESQIASAEGMINSGNLYLWKVNDTIAAMANVAHRSSRHARVNCVYTNTNHRKRGYASALVSELSALLLNEGLTPMLYADINNPDSNKVYRSIGYTECGRIDDIKFLYV